MASVVSALIALGVLGGNRAAPTPTTKPTVLPTLPPGASTTTTGTPSPAIPPSPGRPFSARRLAGALPAAGDFPGGWAPAERNPGDFGMELGALGGCNASGQPGDSVMVDGKSDAAGIRFARTGSEDVTITDTSFVAGGAKSYLDTLRSAVGQCLSGQTYAPRARDGPGARRSSPATRRADPPIMGRLRDPGESRRQPRVGVRRCMHRYPDRLLLESVAAAAARRLQLAVS